LRTACVAKKKGRKEKARQALLSNVEGKRRPGRVVV